LNNQNNSHIVQKEQTIVKTNEIEIFYELKGSIILENINSRLKIVMKFVPIVWGLIKYVYSVTKMFKMYKYIDCIDIPPPYK
jgi:hypothetical protein